MERRDLAQPQPVGQLTARSCKPTDERYDRAHEFIEVCRKLWDSWDEDAVVMDRDGRHLRRSGQGASHRARGPLFKSRGPLNVVRSPQNGPAILQAGTSGKGRDFAARYADAMFAIQPNLAGAKALYDDIKRGVVDAGRPAEACKMLFGVQPIIGASRAEAEDKQAEHNALVPLEGGLAILSGHLDFDLSTLPLDTIMAHRTEPKLQRMQTRYRTHDRRTPDPAPGGAEPRPERRPAADGRHACRRRRPARSLFRLRRRRRLHALADLLPGAIEEFVDLVVPELQRRGRFRQRVRWKDPARSSESGRLIPHHFLRRKCDEGILPHLRIDSPRPE